VTFVSTVGGSFKPTCAESLHTGTPGRRVPAAWKRPGETRGGTNEVSATHSNFW
jgi:hypothetical protein